MQSLSPLPYRPEFEQLEKGEAETTQALIETMHKINQTTSKNYGRAVRASFGKSFGLLDGELTVVPDLPPELAQGIFAAGKTYPVVLRFSTAPGDILPDSISTARGLAMKVIGVDGERLPDAADATTQDFIFVDARFFFNSTLKGLLGSLGMLAATTDKIQPMKRAVSAVTGPIEAALEAVGMESSFLKHMGGQQPVHPLGDTYNTQAPMLYGPYMAKFRLIPASPAVKALIDRKIELLTERPDTLREELIKFFATKDGEWELQVQLCTDIDKMPVEDPAAIWPEDLSPFRTVARLKVAQQLAWSEEKSKKIDDCMSFNPWHGLTAHRPIGAIMRARRLVYPSSAQFRGNFNGCPMHEPKTD